MNCFVNSFSLMISIMISIGVRPILMGLAFTIMALPFSSVAMDVDNTSNGFCSDTMILDYDDEFAAIQACQNELKDKFKSLLSDARKQYLKLFLSPEEIAQSEKIILEKSDYEIEDEFMGKCISVFSSKEDVEHYLKQKQDMLIDFVATPQRTALNKNLIIHTPQSYCRLEGEDEVKEIFFRCLFEYYPKVVYQKRQTDTAAECSNFTEVNKKNIYERDILWAIKSGSVPLVDTICTENGSSVLVYCKENLPNNMANIMKVAINSGSLSMVVALLLEIESLDYDRSKDAYPIIFEAIKSGDADVFKEITDQFCGYSLSMIINLDHKRTLIVSAIRKGTKEIIERVLKACPYASVQDDKWLQYDPAYLTYGSSPEIKDCINQWRNVKKPVKRNYCLIAAEA